MPECRRHGLTWTGLSMAHCESCGALFGVVSSFDLHRKNGECLQPAKVGLHQDERGVWRQPSREETG